MSMTFIGAIQLLIGAYLYLFSSLQSMFGFVLASTLFGGSAAVYILGGASIPPASFALAFLLLRALTPGSQVLGLLGNAIRGNAWLAAYTAYGVVAAVVMPHLFEGTMNVTPLRGQVRQSYGSELARILASEPLQFSMQNLTTSIYMIGALAIAVMAYTISVLPGGRDRIVRMAGIIGTCHAALGFAGIAFKSTPLNAIFLLLRNGNYAQLDHEYEGFARMSGVWPEASSFASYAIIWLVFNFECWLRAGRTRWSGIATLSLSFALVASTSSSAYVGLAIFGAVTIVRAMVTPGLVQPSRLAAIAISVFGLIAAVALILALSPALAERFHTMLVHMTFEKADSFSGRQRLFWAEQGITAFQTSYGLGIGPGSFRSSSFATAILGSLGVVGVATFSLHMLRTFSPARRSTYMKSSDLDLDVGAAAAWAVAIAFCVASISYPSANPSFEFALLTGVAIGLRARQSLTPRKTRGHAITSWGGPIQIATP